MAGKGQPKTGGRQKGSKNKAAAATAAAIAASGLTPLEFMVNTMKDETKEYSVRLDAAKAAAPYVHPKLQNSVVKHEGDLIVHIDADLKKAL